MSMNRREAFKGLAAIGATAGVSAAAVDASGAITPPEEAKGKFAIVLRTERVMSPEAVERLREQFNDFLKRAGIDAPVAILPHGMQLSTVKHDGSIESTDKPPPVVAEKQYPWMGEAMFQFTTRHDLYRRVFIKGTAEPEGDVGSRTVKVTLSSIINPIVDKWQPRNPAEDRAFETTHTIRIDETQNAFNNWDSVEAFGDHNKAADGEANRIYQERLRELAGDVIARRESNA